MTGEINALERTGTLTELPGLIKNLKDLCEIMMMRHIILLIGRYPLCESIGTIILFQVMLYLHGLEGDIDAFGDI